MALPMDDTAVTAVAVGLLLDRGYEATTVGQLADAVGTSRSSFFRRFRSKEDVVFADHEYLLAHLRSRLEVAGGREAPQAVADAARTVLEHHLRRPDVARARHQLLQAHPGLRDRELVTSHRYERLFVEHLRAASPVGARDGWAVTAFAAGVVAVHNEVLRGWLRGTDEAEPVGRLDRGTSRLLDVFAPHLGGRRFPAARVLVASYDADADPAVVLEAVRSSLSLPGG